MKTLLFALLPLCLLFTSCSNDDDIIDQRSTEEVTEKFRFYFYDGDSVRISNLPDFKETEWAVAVTDGSRPLEVFMNITGLEVAQTDTYSYIWSSPDGHSTISIVGKQKADADGEYALMKVKLPGCPNIEIVHMVTKEYYNGYEPVVFLEDEPTALN